MTMNPLWICLNCGVAQGPECPRCGSNEVKQYAPAAEYERYRALVRDELVPARDQAEARVGALEAALAEARPYVFNRIGEFVGTWRAETASEVLTRVDAALQASAKGAEE